MVKMNSQNPLLIHEKLQCNFQDPILCRFRWTNENFSAMNRIHTIVQIGCPEKVGQPCIDNLGMWKNSVPRFHACLPQFSPLVSTVSAFVDFPSVKTPPH